MGTCVLTYKINKQMKFCTILCKRDSELGVKDMVVVNSSKAELSVLPHGPHCPHHVLPTQILARAHNLKAHKRLLGGEELEEF